MESPPFIGPASAPGAAFSHCRLNPRSSGLRPPVWRSILDRPVHGRSARHRPRARHSIPAILVSVFATRQPVARHFARSRRHRPRRGFEVAILGTASSAEHRPESGPSDRSRRHQPRRRLVLVTASRFRPRRAAGRGGRARARPAPWSVSPRSTAAASRSSRPPRRSGKRRSRRHTGPAASGSGPQPTLCNSAQIQRSSSSRPPL